ncbi:MAG: 50S ribosomal protein L11 methyltransferase [Candidatus Omnitrophica bacterium]|nr:50S ribosomal protein L11 methyltransferase [Candidatus Omnitrophota bacterium]
MMGWRRNGKILHQHQSLLADTQRVESYRKAIFKKVKPGDVVLDLGSGTGILAFFACQAGARCVYAVEAGGISEIAEKISKQNGFQNKMVFLRDLSYRVTLPRRVDVLITEMTGKFGLDGGLLGSILDARTRFLKREGTLVPQAVELWAVPVEHPEAYRRISAWKRNLYGMDFSSVRPLAANHPHPVKLHRKNFLCRPLSMARISLLQVQTPSISCEAAFVAQRDGVLHGIGGWFLAELSKGVVFTNGPTRNPLGRSQFFFPLPRPLPLKRGSGLKASFSTYDGFEWSWRVRLKEPRKEFTQSTFLGFPISREKPRGSFTRP